MIESGLMGMDLNIFFTFSGSMFCKISFIDKLFLALPDLWLVLFRDFPGFMSGIFTT